MGVFAETVRYNKTAVYTREWAVVVAWLTVIIIPKSILTCTTVNTDLVHN